ncbi:MAG: M64 family metallopeptidase [Planctomycetota bacterium]|mgnify:CR=1 FL=1|nr:M64 family metallopeptidase [Planctomycetota bacterium]
MKLAFALLVAVTTASCSSTPHDSNTKANAIATAVDFGAHFTGRTLRFDYVHTGDAKEEHIVYSALRLENEWPGSRTQLVDESGLGKYLFEVLTQDQATLLYSRPFASIYGEWETTGEAKIAWRAFQESQRFPEPKTPVLLRLSKRGDDDAFAAMFSVEIDPTSRFVDRSRVTSRGEVVSVFENGAPATKVDLAILAEGYRAEERAKFVADTQRLVGVMFDTEPFRSRKSDFNVRAVFVPSVESGISNPRKDVYRDAPLGCSFNAFDSDRYVLTFEDVRLREVAAQAPYDALILLVNERKYGGGGIFNLWATATADTEPAPYIFVHEFGHSFAGLADEYYTSQVAYEGFAKKGVEPWEPNVTALLDTKRLKWGDLVEPTTALPSVWNQAVYDEMDIAYQAKRKKLIDEKAPEEASEALMREVKVTSSKQLQSEPLYGKVGAFEGAMYEAKGLYRSELDCIMFTRNPTNFCRVCTRALEHTIDRFTK